MESIIKARVPVVELLAGLAEEAAELAHAALKLRRVFDGRNPTPVGEDVAMENLYEEIADVQLYMSMLELNGMDIARIMDGKRKRWEKRLQDSEVTA